MTKYLKKIVVLFFLLIPNSLYADFFEDITNQIVDNSKRLSYGVSVTDVNQDGNFDFVVTGFGYLNLALSYENGKLVNIVNQKKFTDEFRRTIGVAACDIDKDGYEEIYFLNTDTYSGTKKYSDRLIDLEKDKYVDLFEIEKNQRDLNLTAGRSVVCVDRKGDGNYGVYVANYGGPTRFYEYSDEIIVDKSVQLNLAKVTGGRAVVAGHIISDKIDVFAANERGANFLYKNNDGEFLDVANEYRVEDFLQNGRGTALSDIYYRGRLDILNGNWGGFHRAYVLEDNIFKDIAKPPFDEPSRIRTVISADLDNDGYDEVFMNNIGDHTKVIKILDNGVTEHIQLDGRSEPNGYGTGAAVADIDNDGVLELLVSHGESFDQPLSLYKAKVNPQNKYLRIKPLNKYGAPARGATVTLISNLRKHSKTIDSGSGYLCQMEPVAHYGIRENEKNIKIQVRWTNGETETISIKKLNKTIVLNQK